MTNNELTLDQLTAIVGGCKKMTLAEQIEWIKSPWCFPIDNDLIFGVGGSADPGGDDI